MPNLLPYLMASLVLAASSAILSAVGWRHWARSDGRANAGMTVYWMLLLHRVHARAVVVDRRTYRDADILFVGLYLVSAGLDEFANPRLRRRGA